MQRGSGRIEQPQNLLQQLNITNWLKHTISDFNEAAVTVNTSMLTAAFQVCVCVCESLQVI